MARWPSGLPIEGRFEDADALLAQSFRIDLELGNLPFVSVDLVRFALVTVRTGKPLDGAQLLSLAAALRDEIGFALESWMTQARPRRRLRRCARSWTRRRSRKPGRPARS